MLILVRHQLQHKPISELWGLHRALFNQLSHVTPCTAPSTNILLSLENVQREMASRDLCI